MQKHMNYSLDILFYMSSLMFKKSMKASRVILIAMLFTVLNANTIEFEKGWNFVGFDNEISFASDSSFSDAKKVKILWKYNNITKEWSIYSPNTQINDLIEKAGYTKATLLENSNGAWILANENFNYEPSSKNHTQTNNDIQVSQGWNLLSGVDNATLSLTDNLFVNSAMVWVYRKGTWYLKHNLVDVNSTVIKNLETINQNEAFWLYKTADTNSTNEIEKYYGKWIYMLTGDELYIDSNYTMNDFTVIDNDLIQITKDGNTSNLMRSSVPNIQVKGTIETLSGTGLGRMLYLSLVDIAITLKNVNDSNIKAETTVDENGSFIMPQKLPSGTYDLTVKDNKNVLKTIQKDVEIKNAVEDLGVFKLTGTAINNFKAQLIVDAENVYADGNTYTGKIRVFNISDKDGLGLYYEINSTDSSIKEFAHENVKGSVLAKGYKDVPISFSFNTIDTNSKKVTVDVKINDANSNTWIDTFDFTIYKTELSVNIATELASIKGYMILPHTNEIKRIDLVNGSIKMPSSDQEYHMVLVNTSILDETTYSIGINTPADTNFDSLWQTNIHEPNNLGKDAKVLKVNEKVMSYLHLHDVDYWKISSVSKMPPQISDFIANVDENSSIGTSVGTISVISIGDSEISSYAISGDDSQYFTVSNSGKIKINGNLDYETKNSYSFKVTASNRAGSSLAKDVNITVLNFNEITPTITSSATVSVNENQTSALTITATDADGDTLTYLIAGIDASSFNIDSSSGIVTFKVAPDYEMKSSYTFIANVSDGLNIVSTNVDVNITNLIDTVPILLPLTLSIDEYISLGSIIGDATIVGVGDSPINAFHSDSSNFDINNSGTIRTNSLFDYASQSVYDFNIYATNVAGNSESVSVKVNINIPSEAKYDEALFDITALEAESYLVWDKDKFE